MKKRLLEGAIEEVKTLVKKKHLTEAVRTSIGVAEIIDLINGSVDQQTCVERWSARELQYAKNQITWWKKQPGVRWLNVEQLPATKKLLVDLAIDPLY